MSYKIVDYHISLNISLSYKDFARLLIKNDKVAVKVGGTEPCVLYGSGTYIKEPNFENGGTNHIFRTSADLRGEYLWVKVTLHSKDNYKTFSGQITFDESVRSQNS